MVTTQLASGTLAALKVLEEGGNAVDAAIAAVFHQQVADYHMVFLFGSMSAIYFDAASGKYYAISAVAQRPRADRGEHGDASKVAVGGTVRGLAALAKRFGTRPWASYVEPAIAEAERGPIVTSFMYGLNFALFDAGVLDDGVSKSADGRKFYMPDGHLVPVGHRWKMPALAATLRKVATEGADYMYTGEWGQKFVKEAMKRGGRITAQDMAEYQPVWDEPVRFTYRGHEILGSPAPDTGGLFVGYALNILENFDLARMGHYASSADTLEVMARALGRVADETRWAIRDPLDYNLPGSVWLSKDYGRLSAEFVRNTTAKANLAPARETSQGEPEEPTAARTAEVRMGSDHLVVVDAKGNWLSMLHTIHGGAPGVFIDGVRATGTGARATTTGPGRRITLPITAIMIAKDGRPWLAMGTPGNPPQPVTQVLVNVLDFGMDPKDAAVAPRFWAFQGTERTLDIESRIAKDVRTKMAERGIAVNDIGEYNYHTGSMQIVWRDGKGTLHGVTDPRRLGYAAGY
jgi:gamma-glutamyltranspeptidase/glutathione hydrolase